MTTRPIPWLRVFIEGVVIVGSILLVAGCATTLSGTYSLVSVGGSELPASVEFELFGTSTITVDSGSLTLRSDSTYEGSVSWDGWTGTSSGTFALSESNVVHFTPGPDSEDSDPFEGTWDGDRMTLMFDDLDDFGAFVFRRRR